MENISTLFEYIGNISPSFVFIFTAILTLLFFIILILVRKSKNPKFPKILSFVSVGVLSIWLIILILTISGVVPIYEEVLRASDCCAYFDEEPSLFTKFIATLPFVSLALGMVALISKKTIQNIKKNNKKA